MFWLMPLISGLGTWAATGDFKKGLMSGLLGAGIGGIAGALGNAAGGAASAVKSATDAASAVKGATDAASATQGIGALAKGTAEWAGVAPVSSLAGNAGNLAQAAQTGVNGVQAVGQAANAVTGSGQAQNMLRMGADFLARKPVTSGLMLSSLVSSGLMETPKTPDKETPKRFDDEARTVDRHTLPFTGGPPPGPSTYVRGEPQTPDNPYRYGQYEGEKMFFDNPGLERGTNGELPPLPDGGNNDNGGNPGDLLGILGVRGRFRRGHPHAFFGGGKISGPGDGQSDHIPAQGPGFDIRLSDGEFVIPADVVSALGAGSSDAGAKRLESAMSKIRTMSYGSSRQARRPGRVSL